MLRHDLINHPFGPISKTSLAKIKSDLNSFELLSEEEMQKVLFYPCLMIGYTTFLNYIGSLHFARWNANSKRRYGT